MKTNWNTKDINRESSKIIFVANTFNTYQKNAINFHDLPIELWEAKVFGNDIVIYKQLKAKDTTTSIKNLLGTTKNPEIEKITKELKIYTIEDHF
jgi:hypothetical protein